MVCFLFLRGFLIGKWGVILQQANTDMIKGSIFKSILWFSIPLLIGNFFQQLYN
ncbi:MAG: MATE family efflux transporter, partial [Clostridiales bacterium]|nr:MATE family efflux transporter [Clostridiales bacterium]